MSERLQVLVALSTPAALKELMGARNELELLALREPAQLAAAMLKHLKLSAVVVEHAKDRRQSIEILQNVRSIRPSVRRVAIADPEDLSGLFEGLSSGAIDEIVYRPVDPAHLVAAVTPTATPKAVNPPPVAAVPPVPAAAQP